MIRGAAGLRQDRRIRRNPLEHDMTRAMMIATAGLLSGLTGFAPAAYAESCYDLWYQRNAVYDDNGFCFSSELGKQTFDNSDCWTKNPNLMPSEVDYVAKLKAEEKRRGCKVNN